jgi:DNA polymerase-3 subunit alpha
VGNTDKLLKYLNACRDMDIAVLPPDVNRSQSHFTVPEQGRIIFGLAGVKNVGDEAIREIVDARAEGGPYKSLLDLAERVNLRKVTKRVLENLIKSGSMDCFGVPRAEMADALDRVVATAQKRAKDRDSGQMSLMGMAGMDVPSLPGTGLPQDGPPLGEWADDERLRQEKEALGFFLSSHPLLTFRHEIRRMKLVDLQEAADYPGGVQLRTAVIVTGVKEIITKKGGKMAFLEVEDLVGGGECAVFPDSWTEMKEIFTSDQPLLLEARGSDREGPGEEGGPKRARLVAEKVLPLAEALATNTLPVVLSLREAQLSAQGMDRLKDVLARFAGKTEVQLWVCTGEFECRLALGPRYRVTPCQEFWKAIDAL